jgi:hypothetical protein
LFVLLQEALLVFMWIIRYSCVMLTKFEFSRNYLEEYSNIRVNYIQIPLLGAEMFRMDIQTENYDEASSGLSQFCKRSRLEEHSFPQTRHLQSCHVFLINVLATGPTKVFHRYWSTQIIFGLIHHQENIYVNFCILVFGLSEAK